MISDPGMDRVVTAPDTQASVLEARPVESRYKPIIAFR
jgi:hypothetical protein